LNLGATSGQAIQVALHTIQGLRNHNYCSQKCGIRDEVGLDNIQDLYIQDIAQVIKGAYVGDEVALDTFQGLSGHNVPELPVRERAG
jgi:hypothetical protein